MASSEKTTLKLDFSRCLVFNVCSRKSLALNYDGWSPSSAVAKMKNCWKLRSLKITKEIATTAAYRWLVDTTKIKLQKVLPYKAETQTGYRSRKRRANKTLEESSLYGRQLSYLYVKNPILRICWVLSIRSKLLELSPCYSANSW